MKTMVASVCVLWFCMLLAEEGMSQSQQPDPNDPLPSQRSCVFESREVATRVACVPLMQKSLALLLKTYSTEWAENYTRILASDDENAVESKEVEYLLSLHVHLQKEFADWGNLDETHQSVLEKTYGILWRRLLELRAYPAVQDAYRSTLRGDGNELSSLLYATSYSEYASWAYPEIRDDLVAVFERTHNAAVICNCCSAMLGTWFVASRPNQEEFFLGVGGASAQEPRWTPHAKELSEQCGSLFRVKLNQLTAKPLTEQTAMGVIIIREAISYQQSVGVPVSPAQQRVPSYHTVTGLYEIKQLMGRLENNTMWVPYGSIIHDMLSPDELDGNVPKRN
ncbi:MAG: hypothetical protein PHE53_04155 [Thermoguttaceae bacterium]|nr:hypothetical protein [Thermoguttaceae bacterium]